MATCLESSLKILELKDPCPIFLKIINNFRFGKGLHLKQLNIRQDRVGSLEEKLFFFTCDLQLKMLFITILVAK
jgi:hypothetical protein